MYLVYAVRTASTTAGKRATRLSAAAKREPHYEKRHTQRISQVRRNRSHRCSRSRHDDSRRGSAPRTVRIVGRILSCHRFRSDRRRHHHRHAGDQPRHRSRSSRKRRHRDFSRRHLCLLLHSPQEQRRALIWSRARPSSPRPPEGAHRRYDAAEPQGRLGTHTRTTATTTGTTACIWGENLDNISIIGPGLIWGKGLSRG